VNGDQPRREPARHGALEHRYLYGELSYNRADFYDLFGPTKTSRKGTRVEVGLRRGLIYDLRARWTWRPTWPTT